MLKQIAFLSGTFLLMLGLFVLVERTFSTSFQGCIAKYENDKGGASSEKYPSMFGSKIDSYVKCTGEFIDADGSAITALATIVIATFTCTLWFATNKQGELTRESLIADKRAFVFANGFHHFWDPGGTPGIYNWRFRPIWRNSGDTPTKDLTFHTACELRNTPLPPDFSFDYSTTNIGTGLIGPRYENMGGLAPLPPAAPITPQDILDVQQNRKFLYLIGWARYSDVFPNTPKHITRFCWMVFPNGDPNAFVPKDPNNPLTFDYVHFAQGNCTDDE